VSRGRGARSACPAPPVTSTGRARAWVVALSIVGSTGVLMAPTAVAAAGSPSPASQTNNMASLQDQIVASARQLGTLSTEIATTQTHLQTANASLRADQATLAGARRGLERARARLRTIALDAYMGSGNVMISGIQWGSPTKGAASQEYRQIAADHEANAADAFARSQRVLAGRVAQVRTEQAAITIQFAALQRQQSSLEANVSHEQSILTVLRQQQARRPAPTAHGPQGLPIKVVAIAHSKAPGRTAPVATTTTSPVTLTTSPVTTTTAPPTKSPDNLAEDLAKLRECESGDNYQANTGNGYYGAYQFSLATWRGLGYSGLPSAAPPATQDAAATRLEETGGWSQWPVCAAELGLD
jgi:Transglycosylase-like domain